MCSRKQMVAIKTFALRILYLCSERILFHKNLYLAQRQHQHLINITFFTVQSNFIIISITVSFIR